MICYEIDLSKLLKVTLLGKTVLFPPARNISRYINEYILYVVESGSLKLLKDSEKIELVSGDVAFFRPGEYQKPVENTECTFYYLHFTTDGVSETEMTEEEYHHAIKERKINFSKSNIYGSESYNHIKILLKKSFNISDKIRLEQLITAFRENILSYGCNTPELRMNLSFESASILMKAEDACCRSNSKKSVKEDDKIYAKAKAIENYVRLHYNQSFGSSDIERDLLINFDYSNRIFKKIYGYSIIKYRNMLRINTAKTLICSMPLNEIASVTGFNDIYYFSKCFKKFTGVSPSKYITPIENAADISKG